MSKFTWLLDAGHGHDTRGKRSTVWPDGQQLFEFEYNRAIAVGIASALEYLNIDYKFISQYNHDMSLLGRAYIANNQPDISRCILVSIHGNAANTERAEGFEVFTSPGSTRSDKIATIFYDQLKKHFPDEKHRPDYSDGDPDKEAKFTILTATKCSAILTENGFFTNRKQCLEMLKLEWRLRVIKAHVEAIRQVEKLF